MVSEILTRNELCDFGECYLCCQIRIKAREVGSRESLLKVVVNGAETPSSRS